MRTLAAIGLAMVLVSLPTGCGQFDDGCALGSCSTDPDATDVFEDRETESSDTSDSEADEFIDQPTSLCVEGLCATMAPFCAGGSITKEHITVTGPGVAFTGISSGGGYVHMAGPAIPFQVSPQGTR